MIEPFGRVSPALSLSQDGSNGDSLPIGTIIAYNGLLSAIPIGWHLCDGSDGTPDLRGRFLERSDIPGIYVAAGFPNITGSFIMNGADCNVSGALIPACYRLRGTGAGSAPSYHGFLFDASACNDIYGDSETVQPPAITVRYYIKAK